MEPDLVNADISQAGRRHETRRDQRDQEGALLPVFRQEDRDRPEREYGQGLIRPTEIAPNRIESVFVGDVEPKHQPGQRKHGEADSQAPSDSFLVDFQRIRDDQTGAAQGRVATGDRRCHYAEYCQDAAQHTEPTLGYDRHDFRRGGAQFRACLSRASREEEIGGDRRPDQGNDALCDHGAIKDRPSLLLVPEATGHQGRLGAMETADRPAGDRDEQAGEDRLPLQSEGRSPVGQPIPELRDRRPFDQQSQEQGNGHEQQGCGEDGIEFADDLVDGHEGGDQVVDENDAHPDHECGIRAAGEVTQDDGRAVDEYGADKHQQQDREEQHHRAGPFAKVEADDLRQSGTSVANGQHPGEIVVDGPGENAAEYDPQIGGGTEFGSHDGSEDGPRSRDIEELDHKDPPAWHLDIVDAVRLFDGGRRLGGIRPENLFCKFSVKQIP